MGILDAALRRIRGTGLPSHLMNHPTLGLGALASDLSLRGKSNIIKPLYRGSEIYRPEHFEDFDRAAFSYGSLLRQPQLVNWPAFPDVPQRINFPNENFLGYEPTAPTNLNLDDLYLKLYPGEHVEGLPAEDHSQLLADILDEYYKQHPNLDTVPGLAPSPYFDYPLHVKNKIEDQLYNYFSAGKK